MRLTGTEKSIAAARGLLERFPRQQLGFFPTPLQRLRPTAYGGATQVFLKRDDQTGLAFGGNKVRKLEYLVGDALRLGADTLVTVGAAQSNHARMTAAAAASVGMDCDLVLAEPEIAQPSANLLLDEVLGARVHFVPSQDWAELDAAMLRQGETLRAAGSRPYLIPLGGSSAIGVLGFVEGLLELYEQFVALDSEPDLVVLASSSGASHAGLEVGRRLIGAENMKVLGFGVAKTAGELRDDISRLASETLRMIGVGDEVSPDEVAVDLNYLGGGYAAPTPEGIAAIRVLARTAGVLLDPAYTGKAFAGVLDLLKGTSLREKTVVFWHTGGGVALFATEYEEALSQGSVNAPPG